MNALDLDVALRAYVPAFEQVGSPLPAQITLTNIGEARKATGLTWEPHVEPQYRVLGGTPAQPLRHYEEVPGYKYVTRGPGGPILDSAHDTYRLFSNQEVFEVAETLGMAAVELGQQVRFVAGGELAGGRKVFLLADLGAREIKGDPSPHVRFLGMVSSHDGTAALKVLGTDLRWKCTNMIRAAELRAAANGTAFAFRHTAKIARRLADSQKAITAALLQHEAIETETRALLDVRVRPAQMREWIGQYALARVIAKGNPLRRDQAAASPQRAHALGLVENELTAIIASPTCDGIRDTGYAAIAAAAEYLDNVRPANTPDARFARTMLNTEPGKLLALDVLRDIL